MLTEEKKVFLHKLCSRLKQKDKNDTMEIDRKELIYDIIQYFKLDSNFLTIQYLIGMDLLSCSFVAKNWKGNSNTNKYKTANRIVVKEYTIFYFDC